MTGNLAKAGPDGREPGGGQRLGCTRTNSVASLSDGSAKPELSGRCTLAAVCCRRERAPGAGRGAASAEGYSQTTGCGVGWASFGSALPTNSGVARIWVLPAVPCGPSEVWSHNCSVVADAARSIES